MGSIYFVIFILITALCLFFAQPHALHPADEPRPSPRVPSPATPPAAAPPRVPRERSDLWQQDYPISPHRNRADTPGTPLRATRRGRRVLRNIINAGVHEMNVKHQRRMSLRESALSADDSFLDTTRDFFEPSLSGYYSDVSEPFEDYTEDDSFFGVDGAPFLSEEEGDYSQYPILDLGGESPLPPHLTPRQRAMQEFQRSSRSKTPSKVSEVIEKGSGKTLHGRRRERLHRQRSRGLQKSTGAVPRKLDFSPYHTPRRQREASAASLELPWALDARAERGGFVEPDLAKKKVGKAPTDEENELGVRSVRNYAAQINSRLRGKK